MIDGAVQRRRRRRRCSRRCARSARRSTRSRRCPRPRSCACTRTPRSRCPCTSATRALIDELPAEAIRTLVELAGPGSGSPLLMVELRQLGGALGRVDARPRRARRASTRQFVLFARRHGVRPGHGAPPMLGHADRLKDALAPWTGAGHYLNFAEHEVDTSASYGAFTYRRLQAVKARVDPDNVIHANHAICRLERRWGGSTTASTSGWRPGSPASRCSSSAPPRRATTATSTSRRRGRSARCGCSTSTPSPTWTSSAAARRRSPTCARTAASCVMFCAFEGPPRIVRLHGRGRGRATRRPALRRACWRRLRASPQAPEARRAIIRRRTSPASRDSCGYGVPLMNYDGERPHTDLSTAKRLRVHGPDAMRDYQEENNLASIDGLPAVELT